MKKTKRTTNHPSPITTHQSPLTTHQSPLPPHPSPLTSHPSLLTSHPSLLLQTIALTAGYKKARNIVRSINLSVEPGEFVGLFGTNGAGKSTIMKAIMGLLYRQEGQILYTPGKAGTPVDIVKYSTDKRSRMGIKYLTQDARIFPGYTVKENLLFAVGFDRASYKNRFPEIRTLFTDFADKSFLYKKGDELSGGEREKTAIAMVLMTKPNLLMLDEPSAGLSPNLVKDLLQGLKRYQENQGNGMGVILIEQQKLFEAKNICDTVYLLKNGSIIDLQGRESNEKLSAASVSDEKLEQFMLIEA